MSSYVQQRKKITPIQTTAIPHRLRHPLAKPVFRAGAFPALPPNKKRGPLTSSRTSSRFSLCFP
ncbi:hypothetical protein B4113_2329 [Geobacillus sp. B4113_201601]|nr:hypothetical protein B4113_2329 [Geobacillus sp. B4113_201601]